MGRRVGRRNLRPPSSDGAAQRTNEISVLVPSEPPPGGENSSGHRQPLLHQDMPALSNRMTSRSLAKSVGHYRVPMIHRTGEMDVEDEWHAARLSALGRAALGRDVGTVSEIVRVEDRRCALVARETFWRSRGRQRTCRGARRCRAPPVFARWRRLVHLNSRDE